jgi:TetR/AcrR family transcriptional regulator, mexJK operon transcriptional repressor
MDIIESAANGGKKDKAAQLRPEPRRAVGRPKATTVADIDRAVIRVARQLFQAKGYGATSMAEIARAARASKGTVYARFPTKAHLFKAIVDEQIQRTGGWVQQRLPKPKDLRGLLRVYAVRALADSLSAETLQLNRLIYSEAERFPELGDAAFARGEVGLQQVTRYIQEYAELEAIPCRHPEAAAESFLTLLRGWYAQMMLRSRPVKPAEIKAYVQRMLKWFMETRACW